MNSRDFRRHLRPGLFIACGLAYAVCGSEVPAREPNPPKPVVVRGSPAHTSAHPFETEIAAFEKWDRKNAFPQGPILFVGSSSIRLWQTAEAFPGAPVINRGFGGSTIADVNHYFDRVVAKYKPRVIVFYSGDNDVASGKTPRQVFDDAQTFINRVHEELPDTRIFVLSIKPSLARQKSWPKMKEVNALIAKLAEDDEQLEYIDIATPMLAGAEQPPPDLFLDDGLHLNAKGYRLWNEVLSPSFEKKTPAD